MLFLGIHRTIYSIGSNGNDCKIIYQHELHAKLFPEIFGCNVSSVASSDIGLFACLLGNDLTKNIPSKGFVTISAFMKKYVSASTDEEKDCLLFELDHPLPQKLRHFRFFWNHAPAYYVCKTNEAQSHRGRTPDGSVRVVLST
jgi:hypothetical protein